MIWRGTPTNRMFVFFSSFSKSPAQYWKEEKGIHHNKKNDLRLLVKAIALVTIKNKTNAIEICNSGACRSSLSSPGPSLFAGHGLDGHSRLLAHSSQNADHDLFTSFGLVLDFLAQVTFGQAQVFTHITVVHQQRQVAICD